MPTTYVKGFNVASTSTGATVVSLASTEEEPKTVVAVNLVDITSNAVVIDAYLEREKIIETLNQPVIADMTPPREFPINLVIPPGQTFTVIGTDASAGSAGTITGWLEYQITK